MRIIGGRWKGRRLAPVEGKVRPTTDRLRESLFNVLREEVAGSVWLEPFAGSGAVGLEALSRGARLVIFADLEKAALRTLRQNLQRCGAQEMAQVYQMDVFQLLRKIPLPQLDFVFLDPPYDFPFYRKLFDRLDKLPSLDPSTIVLLEVFKKREIDFLPRNWESFRSLRAGDSHLLFLRRRPPEE